MSADVGGAIETFKPTTIDEPVNGGTGINPFCVDSITVAAHNTAPINHAAAICPTIQSIDNNAIKEGMLISKYVCRGLTTYLGTLTHDETRPIQNRTCDKLLKVL